MKKSLILFGTIVLGFVASLLSSCSEEKEVYKDFFLDVTTSYTDTIPTEGGVVSFTVKSDGKWLYAWSETIDWFTQPTLENNILSIVVPANEKGTHRKGSLRFISVSDPTLIREFTLVQRKLFIPDPEPMKADLLDVVFHADGSAEDVSGQNLEVQYRGLGGQFPMYYNSDYKVVVPAFVNNPNNAGTCKSYYRVPYGDNEAVMNGLADGHSLEILTRPFYNIPKDAEYKPLGAHQGGGTGILICKTTSGEKGANRFTFLPNVTTTGKSNWIWCQSDVTPEAGKYYHVIGVWNKEEKMTYIYVNGELRGQKAAEGDFLQASDNARWFGIGGDATSDDKAATNAWCGDMVICRVYDTPLPAEEVELLWKKVKKTAELNVVPIVITDVDYLKIADLAPGLTFNVFGDGFMSGDKLRFTSVDDFNVRFELDAEITPASGDETLQTASVVVPQDVPMGAGVFFLTVVRDGIQYPLGNITLNVTADAKAYSAPKIIAHRGYHADGSDAPENSIAAITAALNLGIYGAEIDVRQTSDGVLYVNHDASFPGSDLVIEESTSAQIGAVKLANGESAPTFDAALDAVAKAKNSKLVVELKSHSTTEKSIAAAEAVVKAVKAKGLEANVDYIAFDYNVCKKFAALLPSAKVQYLGGDKAPSEVAADKIGGIDYSYPNVIAGKPQWVSEAHQHGLEVNVWTVDKTADLQACIKLGVDYITTNNPATAAALHVRQYVTAN